MGVGSGSWGVVSSPLDFHTWYRYSRERLNSAIFRSFSVALLSPPERGLTVQFFAIFLLFFGLFFCCSAPEIFSANALDRHK